MEQRLKACLLSYLIQYAPELLMALQGDQKVGEYIEQKLISVGPMMDRLIQEQLSPLQVERECLEALVEDLRPSRFQFVAEALHMEFPHYYQRLKSSGTLTLEVTNIITICFDLFDTFGFNEKSKEDTAFLYAIKNGIVQYFKRYSAASL